ncbi:mitochondrial import inner membrane translocase subunit Tim29-like [Stegodyphus dumicola]|uniref:mitochondrial import inner membrane translocase subunit Tim29-like n=1 Tax=Stegodyphus dumicola TaxID=202533 RepID=UPI0015B28716|nr:mitochondrial import inner membrane translocase subunit Tim29-like [Stegodyphus dumicola]
MLFAALKSNPGERSFYDQLISCITDLAMVADPIRNPQAEKHVRFLTQCHNQGLLRCIDFAFFTLMWTADYSKDCDMYSAQCKYLKPKYFSFHERIVDVGIFGTWLNLKLKMKDFDVNPNEWAHAT